MAGAYESSRIIANYRDQWPKLSGRFITYSLSYDDFFPKYRSGLGLLFIQDRAGGGKMVTTQVSLNYSYRLMVSYKKLYLQPGISLQYYQRSINFSSLTFADQYMGNTILPSSIEEQVISRGGHGDYSASLLLFGKNFWTGASASNLMKLNGSLAENPAYLPVKLTLFGGYKYKLSERIMSRTEQNIFVAYQLRYQAQLYQLDLGLYYKRNPFMVGLWYRGIPMISSIKSQDAIIFLAGFDFGKFSFSYSYDFTISPLITSTGGANEIILIYKFDTSKSKKKRMGAIPCPKI
jgi:type IX secretion system PorP/SprF family membrane protein